MKVTPNWWQSIHGKTWGLATMRVYMEGESPINAGQAGLILGHYTLWQHLEAIGCEEAIVLEDDAVLCSDFHWRFDAGGAGTSPPTPISSTSAISAARTGSRNGWPVASAA